MFSLNLVYLHIKMCNEGINFFTGKNSGSWINRQFTSVSLCFALISAEWGLIDPVFLNPKRDILLQLGSPTDIFHRSCSLKYLSSHYSFLLHILFLHFLSLSQLQGFVFQKSGGGRESGRETEWSRNQRMPGSGFCYWLAAAWWIEEGGVKPSVWSDGAGVQKPYLQVRTNRKIKCHFYSKENASQFPLREFCNMEVILKTFPESMSFSLLEGAL